MTSAGACARWPTSTAARPGARPIPLRSEAPIRGGRDRRRGAAARSAIVAPVPEKGPSRLGGMRLAASPAGWLTGLCVAAVLAVNVAGIVEIAFTRRGARDEAARLFRLETAARAGSIESALSSSRADLAFLTGSSAISRLEGVDRGAESGDAAATRSLVAAEAALLVFLHGHLEVKRLVVMKGKDRLFIETGRRGGVPILWLSEGNVASQLNDNPRGAAYPAVRRVFAFEQEEPAYP